MRNMHGSLAEFPLNLEEFHIMLQCIIAWGRPATPTSRWTRALNGYLS